MVVVGRGGKGEACSHMSVTRNPGIVAPESTRGGVRRKSASAVEPVVVPAPHPIRTGCIVVAISARAAHFKGFFFTLGPAI